MHRLPLEQQILLVLQNIALVALCVKFFWTGLRTTYVWFFRYLVAAVLQSAVLSLVPFDARLYVRVWMASEGVIVCLHALVVLEVYSLILRDLAGIASLARRYIKTSLGLAIGISLLLLRFETAPTTLYNYFLACDRVVVSSLLVVILFSVAFLVYYPVPLNRNVLIYSVGYSTYLLSKTAALSVHNMRLYSDSRQLDAVLVGVPTACLLFWLFTLNCQGELKPAVISPRWKRTDEDRLLIQLKAINEKLLRGTKK